MRTGHRVCPIGLRFSACSRTLPLPLAPSGTRCIADDRPVVGGRPPARERRRRRSRVCAVARAAQPAWARVPLLPSRPRFCAASTTWLLDEQPRLLDLVQTEAGQVATAGLRGSCRRRDRGAPLPRPALARLPPQPPRRLSGVDADDRVAHPQGRRRGSSAVELSAEPGDHRCPAGAVRRQCRGAAARSAGSLSARPPSISGVAPGCRTMCSRSSRRRADHRRRRARSRRLCLLHRLTTGVGAPWPRPGERLVGASLELGGKNPSTSPTTPTWAGRPLGGPGLLRLGRQLLHLHRTGARPRGGLRRIRPRFVATVQAMRLGTGLHSTGMTWAR